MSGELMESSGQVSGDHEASHYSTSPRHSQSPMCFMWEGFNRSMMCPDQVGGDLLLRRPCGSLDSVILMAVS